MLEKLEKVKEEGLRRIKEAKDSVILEEIRKDLTGKKSALSEVLKNLGKETAETKKTVGMKANEIKNLFEKSIKSKEEEIMSSKSVLNEPIDLTLPGYKVNNGGLHPITQMCYDLNDAFLSLGFEIYSEDEISSEKFAFDNLNFAKDHPARQSMDTYWIEGTEDKNGNERLCLRPHLTGSWKQTKCKIRIRRRMLWTNQKFWLVQKNTLPTKKMNVLEKK